MASFSALPLAANVQLFALAEAEAAVARAYTMAISNIHGSELIMLVLVSRLPADLFCRSDPILADVDRSAAFALVAGMIVTQVHIPGLVARRHRRVLDMGLDSIIVVRFHHLR